ncbi:hypothetical protein Q9L58_010736 [Maublancomyces gigas]|uniref:Uncharacterized protein n=1 Tax=Discina gigas TaxID=1032678 RepID=A0ABR3G3W7_9PEZI
MFKSNVLSTSEIKAAQSKYASAQRDLKANEKTKSKIAERLEGLILDETRENAASDAAHKAAVQAYSDAIAAGDAGAESASNTKLETLLGESDRQRGKRLARSAAITKLKQEVLELELIIAKSEKALAAAQRALLVEITYKRAEILRSKAAELVEAIKKHKEVTYVQGYVSCTQDTKIPLPPTHMQGRIDYIGSHSFNIDVNDLSIEYLLAS